MGTGLVGRRTGDYVRRTIGWICIAVVLALAAWQGVRLRKWVFEMTDPIRFVSDDERGVFWGLQCTGPEGYFNQYDKMQDQVPDWQDSNWDPWLDYSPFRLLVMRQWGAWIRSHSLLDATRPLTDQWQRTYVFNKPVLIFNTCMTGFGAVCAFFLTRHWVTRANGGLGKNHFEGIWQGVVAALMLWFCLDVILSAHAWIQWDSWVIPWYLCAALLASMDFWFLAGIALAIGAMFKAQQLAVAPIFLIWPIVEGRFGAALRWAVGLVFGIGLIVSPWMLTYLPADPLAAARAAQQGVKVSDYPPDLFAIPRALDGPAAIWIVEMVLFAGAAPWVARRLQEVNWEIGNQKLKKALQTKWAWNLAAGVLIFAAVYWPFLLAANRAYGLLGLLAGLALSLPAIFARRKNIRYVLAAAAGGGLLFCMLLFHGGVGWARCSFEYGTVHWPYLIMGTTSNLPGIFELRFGWPHDAAETAFTLPAIQIHWPGFLAANGWWPAVDMDVSEKTMFDTIYGFFLILSGVALGLQARRNDRRFLVALVTPWIMFFLLPVQIHERYLLFASGASACCIGAGVGPALLGFLLTLFSATMYMNRLLDMGGVDLDQFGQNLANAFPRIFSPDSGRTMLTYFSNTHPDIGWGILVVALVFMYLSLAPSACAKSRRQLPPAE